MSEPDVEKGKKKRRRRSARVYLSNAHPLPTPEQLAALVDQFPSDEDDDGPDRAEKRDYSQSERRRMAQQGNALGNGSYPIADVEDLHNAAVLARTGHGDVEGARRLIARRARELGVRNPLGESASKHVGNAVPPPGPRALTDRVSPPIQAGHAACSTGDHGAGQDPMNVPGPRQLALGHPDMRQSTTVAAPLATMRTAAGDNQYADRDVTYVAGTVSLDRLDLAGAAGVASPPGNAAARWRDHISRDSATPRNGTHSLSDPTSHAVAMKNSELRAEFKRMLFPGSGGSR